MPENINASSDLPLVDVKVTNPVTYIKRWWAKIIGNEGMEFRFRVKPLTAMAISIIVASIAFGVGRFAWPVTIPFFEYTPTPLPTPEIWRETAFTGTLQFSALTQRYFLVTTASEAITLDVRANIDMDELVGKRILAAGNYNKNIRTLKVVDAKNMEILPKSPVPVPIQSSTPLPTPVPTAFSSPESSSTPEAF